MKTAHPPQHSRPVTDSSPRRGRRGGPFGLLLAMLVTGCVQTDQQLVLDDDGSGLFIVRYAVPLPDNTGKESAGLVPWDPALIRADFRRYETFGVHLQSVETKREDGWQRLDLSVTFTTLNGLVKTAFFAERTLSLRRNNKGHYILTLVRAPESAAAGNRLELGEFRPEALGNDALKGFCANFEIEAPGRLVEHNGQSISDRRARWVFSGDSDTNVMQNLRDAYFRVVFEAGDLRIPEIGRMHVRLPAPDSDGLDNSVGNGKGE